MSTINKRKKNNTAGGYFIHVAYLFFVFSLDVICQRKLLNLSNGFLFAILKKDLYLLFRFSFSDKNPINIT